MSALATGYSLGGTASKVTKCPFALAIKITGWQVHKRPEGARLRTLQREPLAPNLQSAQAGALWALVTLPACEFIRQGSRRPLIPLRFQRHFGSIINSLAMLDTCNPHIDKERFCDLP